MRFTPPLVLLAWTVFILPASTLAQSADTSTIAEMLKQMRDAKFELGKMPSQENLESDLANKKHELKVYNDQMPLEEKKVEEFFRIKDLHNADAERQWHEVDRYNEKCAGGRKSHETEPQCVKWKSALDDWAARIKIDKDKGESDGKALGKRLEAIAWASGNLRADISRIERQLQRRAALVLRIADVISRLRPHCSSLPATVTSEELKNLCGDREFDGAPVLQPCPTDDCLKARYKGLW